MADLKSGLIWGLVILIAFLLIRKLSVDSTSDFTFQPFEGMTDPVEVTKSFTAQTAQISSELKDALTNAMLAKKSKAELIAISDAYSDYSAQLEQGVFSVANQ
jgi:hypothetical protein